MSDLYDNLLRATDNTKDITVEKYAAVTKIDGSLCSVKEIDTDLEHSNVPILSNVYLEPGDKVVIGFVNNSIYNPVIIGSLTSHNGSVVDWSDIGNKPSEYPPNAHNHGNLQHNGVVGVTGRANYNVVTDNIGKIAVEPKPYIPNDVNELNDIDDILYGHLDEKYDSSNRNLSEVAFTGSYADLSNKPTIPSTSSWSLISITNGTLYYNSSIRMCELSYSRTFNSASQNTLYEWGQLIPSTYRPKHMVSGSGNRNGATIIVDSDGYVYGRFAIAFTSSTSFYYHLMWHY